MAKKAVIGTSPKDSSTDKMDRYIQRNERKEQQNLRRHGKKDLSKLPFNEWPLHEKLKWMETRTDADKFNEKYSSYSTWYDEIQKLSGVYPVTFRDWTSVKNLREVMREMFENKTLPKEAMQVLKTKYKIY